MKSKRSKRAKTLSKRRENAETFPTDLIIEILSRLPMKSVARCRCVSKLWRSIVDHPYLTELFTARASANPRLLFVYTEEDELVFLSSPQPQNLDYDSPPVPAKQLSRIPFGSSCNVSSHVQGLVCLRVRHRRMSPVLRICNPSSGQALTLPKIKRTRGSFIRGRILLGYDPIDNQFKVLSLTRYSTIDQRQVLDKCEVLTLGTEELKWRRIKCSTPQDFFQHGVCINGVLYYPVCTTRGDQMIGCFHVRSETFSFIKVEATLSEAVFDGTLINYNGKLASLISSGGERCVDRSSRSIKLIVIGDFEKQEWSKHKYVLPPLWEDVVGSAELRLVGFVGTNEVVLSDSSKVIYYNVETQGIVRVGIQGVPSECKFATFLNHREDLKFTQAFK